MKVDLITPSLENENIYLFFKNKDNDNLYFNKRTHIIEKRTSLFNAEDHINFHDFIEYKKEINDFYVIMNKYLNYLQRDLNLSINFLKKL